MSCIGCKYYDESVDCCNADENCYQVGRADVIEELKPYVLTNMDGEKFLWLKVDELNKLSFAEKLKEQTNECMERMAKRH